MSGNSPSNWRELCALESFALHNKNIQVTLLIVAPSVKANGRPETDQERDDFIFQFLLSRYDNIRVKDASVEDLTADYPIEKWLHSSSDVLQSTYKNSHLHNYIERR